MNKSESIKSLLEALSKMQIPSIKRTQKVDFMTKGGAKIKYSYASLPEIIEACRQPMAVNGLAISQLISTVEDKVCVETLLGHTSGEWLSSTFIMPGEAHNNPQEMGSLITYARRYSLSAILNIAADEDDDALSAMPQGISSAKGKAQQTEQKTVIAGSEAKPQKGERKLNLYEQFVQMTDEMGWTKEKRDDYLQKGYKKSWKELSPEDRADVVNDIGIQYSAWKPTWVSSEIF